MIEKFNTYKGYPLVRSGNQIFETKEENGVEMTSKVRVVQMDTNEPDPLKAFVKNAERECGLYEALDIANVWLEKAMKN